MLSPNIHIPGFQVDVPLGDTIHSYSTQHNVCAPGTQHGLLLVPMFFLVLENTILLSPQQLPGAVERGEYECMGQQWGQGGLLPLTSSLAACPAKRSPPIPARACRSCSGPSALSPLPLCFSPPPLISQLQGTEFNSALALPLVLTFTFRCPTDLLSLLLSPGCFCCLG